MMLPICALSDALASHLFLVAPNQHDLPHRMPRGLGSGEARRLETNTSVPHIFEATLKGPGEPRVRIPLKRFLACFLTFSMTTQIARSVFRPPAMREAADKLRSGCSRSHNTKIIH